MPSELLQRYLVPLIRRVRQMIGHAALTMVDDAKDLQRVQVKLLAGEVQDGVKRFQDYGLTSRPLPGAVGIFVAVGGSRSNLAFIAFDDPRYRKKNLASGEVALYHHEGDYIHLKNGRVIEVNSGDLVKVVCQRIEVEAAVSAKVTSPTVDVIASTKVKLQTPLVEATADVQIGGNLTVAGTGTIQGALAAQGGLAVTGGAGASVAGNVAVTGGDVTVDGIGAKTHVHPENNLPGGTTGVPQ